MRTCRIINRCVINSTDISRLTCLIDKDVNVISVRIGLSTNLFEDTTEFPNSMSQSEFLLNVLSGTLSSCRLIDNLLTFKCSGIQELPKFCMILMDDIIAKHTFDNSNFHMNIVVENVIELKKFNKSLEPIRCFHEDTGLGQQRCIRSQQYRSTDG